MTTAIELLAVFMVGGSSAHVFDDGPLDRFEFAQPHMGTQFKLVLYTTDEPTARRAASAAFQRIAQLDQILSDYRSDSELNTLCRGAGGPPVAVSDDLWTVLVRSQELSARSGGAFDVSVGPIVRLWRRARRMKEFPSEERLAAARQLVGYSKIRLDHEKRTVQLAAAGMQLDLGGIAKGYASDAAIAVLKADGVTRALVAGSGDVVVSDPPPEKEGWTVGVAPLAAPDAKPTRHILLRNAAVSTSGDTVQFVELGGVRYSHIVDPRTGIGIVNHSTVTVVAPTGTLADGLATAAYVLGPERGLQVIEDTDGAAAFIQRDVDGKTVQIESARFRRIPAATP